MSSEPTIQFESTSQNGFVGKLEVNGSTDHRVEWLKKPSGAEVILDDGDERTLWFRRLSVDEMGRYEAEVKDLDGTTVSRISYNLKWRREAIVVVHGIGEHEDLQTASSYAQEIARDWDEVFEYPYPVPESGVRTRKFRITWRPSNIRPVDSGGEVWHSDVFEHYWQPLVRDSKLSHFAGFVRNRLFAVRALPDRMRDLPVVLLLALHPNSWGVCPDRLEQDPEHRFLRRPLRGNGSDCSFRAPRQHFAVWLASLVGAVLGIGVSLFIGRHTTGLFSQPQRLGLIALGVVAVIATLGIDTRSAHKFVYWLDGSLPSQNPRQSAFSFGVWFGLHVFVGALLIGVTGFALEAATLSWNRNVDWWSFEFFFQSWAES